MRHSVGMGWVKIKREGKGKGREGNKQDGVAYRKWGF